MKTQKPSAKELNAAIRLALMARFSPPGDVIFFEVAIGTGAMGQRRRADAVAMGCWPSRGMKITGFEIKVNRQDWLREKDNPAKAEEIAAYCDFWALVSSPGVVEAKEAPHAWDWYELNGRGGLTHRQTGFQTDAKPLDRTFVASLLRTAGKIDMKAVEVEVERRCAAAEAKIDARVERRAKELAGTSKQMAALEEDLTAICGENPFKKFRDDEFTKAFAAVFKSGIAGTWDGLNGITEMMDSAAKRLSEAADKIRAKGEEMSVDMSRSRKRGK